MSAYFMPSDILLPDFNKVDATAWSVIACDQYTSQPEYWDQVASLVGDRPSTLHLTLPEIYLAESADRVPLIHESMEQTLREVLVRHKNSMIYLERTQSGGKVRRGLVGMIDLEDYDYRKGSASLIRATEATVEERIPPRLAVRRDAALELPHVMLLIDDREYTVIEPLAARAEKLEVAYSFSLMEKGGSVKGYFVDRAGIGRVANALSALISPEAIRERYGEGIAPLLFAVGDGNHSLATAKAAYEEIKAAHGEDALLHPARYALCEVVNLHDSALSFEPIHRVVFGVDPDAFLSALEAYSFSLHGGAEAQQARFVTASRRGTIHFSHPSEQLAVGTVQTFIDGYLAEHPEASVDYIHGTHAVESLVAKEGAVGLLLPTMGKEQLFKTVIADGALPRKTFSMGHAADKRYYLECRRIR